MICGAAAVHASGDSQAPIDEVGIVNVKVKECAAGAGFIFIERVGPARAGPKPCERCGLDRTEGLGKNVNSQEIPSGPESHAHGGHAESVGASCGGFNLANVGHGESDRLFEQNVLSGGERLQGELDM